MSTFTTTQNVNPLQYLMSGLFALLLLAATAVPAQAQMDDGDLPDVNIGGAVSSDAQAIFVEEFENDGPGGEGYSTTTSLGFNRVAAQILANVQFSENVSGYVELSAEPEENEGFSKVSTNIDFVYVNVNVAENLMVQAGTPGIGTANFPRWSDGALVQGNPLVGNSVAFPGTAGNGGVKLIGSYPGGFGFDLTFTRGFGGGQDVSSGNGNISKSGSGLDVYGKARYTGSDLFSLGTGIAFHTGDKGLSIAAGDGDYYNVPGEIITGSGVSSRPGFSNTPTLPGDLIFSVDGEVTPGPFSANALVGYASESAPETDEDADIPDPTAFFGELGAKVDVSDSFFLAGRFSIASDQTDYEEDPEQTSMSRFALGMGYTYEAAMLKLEYANQSQATDPAELDGEIPPGIASDLTQFQFANQDHNWQAITAQFSVKF